MCMIDHYRDILREYWGYDDFRPLQADIIQSVGQGRDTLALMPTGGGKSLCFQVPTMAMEGLCLVITPLIALMKDQVENLRAREIKAEAIYTGLTYREIQIKLDNCQFGNYKFLYVSPERLESEPFRKRLTELPICLIVVDEAHCISQWGYDFRPAYLRIAKIRDIIGSRDVFAMRLSQRHSNVETPFMRGSHPTCRDERTASSPPILALTATATPEVVEDIQDKLLFRERNVFQKSFHRENLSYVVRHTEDKLSQMLHILRSIQGSAIVYVRNRQHTKEIADYINEHFGKEVATYYHAGLSHAEKTKRQEAWKHYTYTPHGVSPQGGTEGGLPIIVCTNAFGMGIDKPDVRVVIHLDLPDSLEAYFQEAGRAGRDGKEAFAVLLYNPQDKTKAKKRVHDNYPEKEFIKRVYEAVGDWYEVGIGSGLGHTFAFPFERFCTEKKLPFLQTYSALQLLSQAGYLAYTEETETNPRILFCCTREELYGVALSEQQDRITSYLLRTYTGIFTEPAYIHDDVIAARLNISVEILHHELIEMARQQIIQYIPRRKTPYITFIQEREVIERMRLPQSVLEDRQAIYVRRIQAMVEYAEQMQFCRSQVLLAYFGENDSDPCGTCDVCRRNKTGNTER